MLTNKITLEVCDRCDASVRAHVAHFVSRPVFIWIVSAALGLKAAGYSGVFELLPDPAHILVVLCWAIAIVAPFPRLLINQCPAARPLVHNSPESGC